MPACPLPILFENDVKMYGTQAVQIRTSTLTTFENDVKMYGTQATGDGWKAYIAFENDVKMYGTQAHLHRRIP